MTRKDPQQHKAYEWEGTLEIYEPLDRDNLWILPTQAALQKLTTHICEDLEISEEPIVRTTTSSRRNFATYYYDQTILFNFHRQSVGTLLHELGHHLTRGDRHGPLWMDTVIKLYTWYLGRDEAKLRKVARLLGLQVHPNLPLHEFSPNLLDLSQVARRRENFFIVHPEWRKPNFHDRRFTLGKDARGFARKLTKPGGICCLNDGHKMKYYQDGYQIR